MRTGSLLALVVAVVAIAVSSAAAVRVSSRGGARRQPDDHAQGVNGHPVRLAQIGLLTSYRWAEPGCAPVFTSHAHPWS